MKPAVRPLMSLYKVSIGRAAFEDVVVGIVPGKFRGMCFEVFRSAAQERAAWRRRLRCSSRSDWASAGW